MPADMLLACRFLLRFTPPPRHASLLRCRVRLLMPDFRHDAPLEPPCRGRLLASCCRSGDALRQHHAASLWLNACHSACSICSATMIAVAVHSFFITTELFRLPDARLFTFTMMPFSLLRHFAATCHAVCHAKAILLPPPRDMLLMFGVCRVLMMARAMFRCERAPAGVMMLLFLPAAPCYSARCVDMLRTSPTLACCLRACYAMLLLMRSRYAFHATLCHAALLMLLAFGVVVATALRHATLR